MFQQRLKILLIRAVFGFYRVSVEESMCVLKQMERAFSVCGTIEYMAPEIVEGGESGHDKVICTFIFYAAICSIKPRIPDSPL